MTEPAIQVLTDSQWVTLLRRGDASEFGADGRGELEALIAHTVTLATEDGQPGGIGVTAAAAWLSEYRYQVDELGFVSGPTCEHLADICAEIAAAATQAPLVATPNRPADEPLNDVEWMLLLRGVTGDLGAPVSTELRDAVATLIQAGGTPHDLDIWVLKYAVDEHREAHPEWVPGALFTRMIANLSTAYLFGPTVAELNNVRRLAGLAPLPLPVGA
jgi:hypothetical protein